MTNELYAKKVLNGEIDEIDASLLNEIIKETNDLYHNSSDGESYLTDAEYDALEVILKNQVEGSIEVGSPVRTGKVDLPYVMGSLDQNYEGDTQKWVKEEKLSNDVIVIGDKQDGVSGSSTYVNGELIISYSRGDGYQGADVTRHLKRIKNSVKTMNHVGILEIRYEVIVREKDFNSMKEELIKNNSNKIPKNARNYVAGQMNAEQSEDWFYENARIIVTSINDNSYSLDKTSEYSLLEKLGFEVTPYTTKYGRELTDEFLTEYLNKRRELTLTEIDGIVLDVNSKTKRKNASWKEGNINPPFSRKYKIASDDNIASATVVKVHWNPSKTGYIKPRVEIEPVELRGVTITYATGFNAKFIVDNKIGKGAVVELTRSGDVIPYILKTTTPGTVEMPEIDYHWNDTEVDIIIDDDSHEDVVINRLCNIFGELKVPMLKKASITKLYHKGYHKPEDIIKLPESKFKEIIGDSAGEKIFQGLKDKLNPISVSTLAGASNILGRGVAIRTMEIIAKELGEKAILNPLLSVNQLWNVNDIGEKTATLIKGNQKRFLNFLEEIEGYYTFQEKVASGTNFKGIKVEFTGVRDNDLIEKIKSGGGSIGGAIKDPKNSYLVYKDINSTSSKMSQAKKILPPENILSHEEAKRKWL